MILAEITGAVDDLGTPRVFYVANGAYTTLPTDDPANTVFLNRVKDAGDLGLTVYGDQRTGGYGRLEVGSLTLSNADGYFDNWIDYAFDGRPIRLKLYDPALPYKDMLVLFEGTADGPPLVTRKTLQLRLKDKQALLDVPVCPNQYAGTNALPNGIEGTQDDIKGNRKPKLFGTVFNIDPSCVNTSKLIYQVNDGAVYDIPKVYDRGVALTKGADYTTSALLIAAANPTSGTYITCMAEGLFRLGALPAGLITADVIEGATAADRTAAQIIKRIAITAGLSAYQINAADVAALDGANPAVVGIWVRDETQAREAISRVAESIGAYAIFDTTGQLRMGRLSLPSGTPVATYTSSQMLDLQRVSQRDGDLPVYQVTAEYARVYAVQDTDLAGSVTAARRAYLAKEYRTSDPQADLNVRAKYLLSPPLVIQTLLTTLDDANAEAARNLTLYKVRRDMYQLQVNVADLGAARLMSVVKLQYSRFGLSAGKLFLVVGLRLELGRSRATLTVWG